MENITRPKKQARSQKSYVSNNNYQDNVNEQLNKIYDYLDALNSMQNAYEIGDIYITKNKEADPNLKFGGKWKQIKDRFLLSCGDIYEENTFGGSATININHSHTLNTFNGKHSGEGNGCAYTVGSIVWQNNARVVNEEKISKSILPPYETVFMWEKIE